MSYSKRAWEEENADADPYARCEVCHEYKDECICGDVATEGGVFQPAQEEEPSSDEAFFAPWANAMVKAELSRGALEDMWERIKVRLDDLGKVDQLIADVFGHRARMVER